MPLTPACLVSDNAGPFLPTTGGIDVGLGDSIAIQLQTPAGVGQWFLTVFGTDELTTAPTLTNVDPVTGLVTSPTSIVTFTFPTGTAGRTILFQSTVTQGTANAQANFGVYNQAAGHRVGAVGETREGNPNFGWAATVNPIIRAGGSGGGGAIVATELSIIAGVFSTTFSTFTRAGSRRVQLAQFPPTVGSLNRSIAFYASCEATTGTCTVQLFDVTDGWAITGCTIPVATPINTEVGSTVLPVGSGFGDLVNGSVVEVNIALTGGGPTDRAIVTNARLVIYYA